MPTGRVNISVVIPAWNEQACIGPLLDSLVTQTRLPDEIVVVDAGSSDETAAVVRGYRQSRVHLLSIGRAYPGVARNAGVQCARFDSVAFTDCGVHLNPGWLQALCAPLENQHVTQVVYGSYEPVTATFFSECAATVHVSPKAVLGGKLLRGPTVASCLLRKTVWRAVGGFPQYGAAEDLIFLERIAQCGFPVAYAPEAVAHWQLSPDVHALFRKFTKYSYQNLLAGRGRDWHAGVARTYVTLLPFLLLAMLHRREWLMLPGVLWAARVARAFYRKRGEPWAAQWRDPRRWVMVSLIMLAFDAATLTGSLQWLWHRTQRRLRGGDWELSRS